MTDRKYHIVLGHEDDQLTLERLAECAGLHPEMIERFVDYGLIEPIRGSGEVMLFDSATVVRVRMIQRVRKDIGVNLAGVSVILDLVDRLRAVQIENELLRSRLP
jgi:DNA-binding transcriptional MerR regulator